MASPLRQRRQVNGISGYADALTWVELELLIAALVLSSA